MDGGWDYLSTTVGPWASLTEGLELSFHVAEKELMTCPTCCYLIFANPALHTHARHPQICVVSAHSFLLSFSDLSSLPVFHWLPQLYVTLDTNITRNRTQAALIQESLFIILCFGGLLSSQYFVKVILRICKCEETFQGGWSPIQVLPSKRHSKDKRELRTGSGMFSTCGLRSLWEHLSYISYQIFTKLYL
jgi:hypothetical protein